MSHRPQALEGSGRVEHRLPDFFLVGHAKSGTTAMYRMLGRHPEIYMSVVKEPWFFAPELRASYRERENPRHPDNLDVYLSMFADATRDQKAGEATPSYLFSRYAARRIAELQPQARIVACLREPASFLRSLHMEFLKVDIETVGDLRRALDLEERRANGESLPRNSTRPQALLYSEHVRYVEQLERYRELFGREQILVLIYEDFRDDNRATIRQVLRFLEVDEEAPFDTITANPAVRVRFPRVQALVRAFYMGRSPATRAGKAVIKTFTPRRLRRRALGVHRRAQLGKPAPPDERLMLELRRRYKPEVERLSRYLDRDLVKFWGYDSLD